jgi:hypothetical protein
VLVADQGFDFGVEQGNLLTVGIQSARNRFLPLGGRQRNED